MRGLVVILYGWPKWANWEKWIVAGLRRLLAHLPPESREEWRELFPLYCMAPGLGFLLWMYTWPAEVRQSLIVWVALRCSVMRHMPGIQLQLRADLRARNWTGVSMCAIAYGLSYGFCFVFFHPSWFGIQP